MSRRVTIVSPHPGRGGGGVERFCGLLGRSLAERGWTVREAGVDIDHPNLLHWDERLRVRALAWTIGATRAAHRRPADLVVTNGQLGLPVPGGPPRLHVYHGCLPSHQRAEVPPGGSPPSPVHVAAGAVAEALAGRWATSVAVSESAAAEVRSHYGVRAAVMPLGIDLERFRPRDRGAARDALDLQRDGRYALFVGRFEPRKGIDLLGPTCERAGVELLLAGSGDEQPPGRLLGQLDPDRLALAYAAADLVLAPSRYEACSYVVLEALACGTPVVAGAHVGWIPTLVREVPGYAPLVAPLEPDALAASVGTALDGSCAEAVASAGEHVRAHHALDVAGRRWVELAERVVAGV